MTWAQTVQVTPTAMVPLIDAGDGPASITNLDPVNTCWLSWDYGVNIGTSNFVTLKPGATRNFDGEKTIYGVIQQGYPSVYVEVAPGEIDIANANLLGSSVTYNVPTPQVIGAGTQGQVIPSIFGTLFSPLNNVVPVGNSLSWDCEINMTGLTNVTPFMTLTFSWYATSDNAGNQVNPLYVESWTLPTATASGGVSHKGHGPCRAAWLVMTVTNDDSAASQNLNVFKLNLSTRPMADDNPRFESIVSATGAVHGYTMSVTKTGENHVVGYWTGSVPISSNLSLLATMYDGVVAVHYVFTTSTTYNYQAQEMMSQPAGGLLIPIAPLISHTAAADETQTYALSRNPLIIKLTNLDAANVLNFTVVAIGQHQEG